MLPTREKHPFPEEKSATSFQEQVTVWQRVQYNTPVGNTLAKEAS